VKESVGDELANRGTSPPTSSGSSTCGSNTPANTAKGTPRIPQNRVGGQAEPANRQGHGPDQACWRTSSPVNTPIFLPLYRLQNIFARNGFEIDRATQSVLVRRRGPTCCGRCMSLMVRRVLASHVVCTDDTVMPMLAPEKRSRPECGSMLATNTIPTMFLILPWAGARRTAEVPSRITGKTLLADAYGWVRRRGGGQRNHPRRMLGSRKKKVRRCREDAPDRCRRGGGNHQMPVRR